MPRKLPAAVISLGSWLCLWTGLAFAGLASCAPRVITWDDAVRARNAEAAAAASAEARTGALERRVVGLKTNPIYRDEWMRREWGLDVPAYIESLPTPARFDGDDVAVAADVPPEQSQLAIWRPTMESVAQIRPDVWLPVSAFLVALGILAPCRSPKRSGVESAWLALTSRYRVDAAHELRPPTTPRESQSLGDDAPIESSTS